MKRKIIVISLMLMMIMALAPFAFAAPTTTKTTNTTYSEEQVKEIISQTAQETAAEVNATVQETPVTVAEEKEDNSKGIGMIAAAIAVGLACVATGIAVAVVASSAVAAVSENPNLLGKTIIFAGMAEGIAVYGLIIAIMILNKI
jgi:V/A-type H+-transporting ATPase subunit K